MCGKTVPITGANSGVGLVTARELAKMGAHLLMVCRDIERGARARAEVPLSRLGQSRREVDVLVNNAGSMFAQRGLYRSAECK